MTFEFDRGIQVRALGDPSVGEFTADLDAGWTVGGGLNGGFLLAVMGNAISQRLQAAGHPDPLAMSAYFVSASAPGPAWVRTRLVRSGGRISTVGASLVQQVDGQDVERITALASYGDLSDQSDDIRTTMPEPEFSPIEDCVATTDAPDEIRRVAPLLERFATRLDPATAMWALGSPSGTGLIQGWFKLADDRPLDPIALLMVVDALPPVTFDLGMPGWAPTIELTAHIRAKPAPGWAKVRHYTRNLAGGFFEEDCEVWDSTGRLVAQSRQLAMVPKGQ